MGKAENFKNPFLRFFMYQIGAFSVERGTYDRSALHQALRVLKNGQVLGMFPEGTRTYGRGMLKAKSESAILALKMNCPIVPVAMDGTYQILKRFLKRPRVTIKVCPPICPSENMGAENLTNAMMKVIAENLPEKLRGVYANISICFLIR